MKIVQLLPSMAYGDAIGNNVIALNKKLSNMGYETAVYAERIDRSEERRVGKEC